ncbi:hypothetical protein D9758_015346 [Tetrapyrgos nigripes]|uniref:DUF4218 domain-containing protein n=1 Tax=Tetrapyrgos nigripes TaxID=182062 RepID=A0A8H5FNI9_9AGAR|nr:hypothetical protein D9758_015346 [Tetrapyrgos nigripes]
MPPRLRGGRPVGQRRPPSPEPYHLCTCDVCSLQTFWDSEGIARSGRLFYSPRALVQHKREYAENMALSSFNDLTPPEPVIPEIPIAAIPFPLSVNTRRTESQVAANNSASASVCDGSQVGVEGLEQVPDGLTPGRDEAESQPPRDWIKVQEIRRHLMARKQASVLDPTSFEFYPRPAAGMELPEAPCLRENYQGNSYVLGHLLWLEGCQKWLEDSDQRSPCWGITEFRLEHQCATRSILDEIQSTRGMIVNEWKRQRDIATRGQERIVSVDPVLDYTESTYVFMLYGLLCSVLHLIAHVSLDYMSFVLGCLRLTATLHGTDPVEIDSNLPRDMRTVVNRFNLVPQSTEFVCCPRCFKLYPLKTYPEFCDGARSAAPLGTKCQRRLRSKEPPLPRARKQPVRTFQYNDIRQWIASLYSRKDLAPHLGRRFDPTERKSIKEDIWDADLLQDFKGPDGRLFFGPDVVNEDRLLFSLNFDSFNPYGNRQAGKKASTGGIYLICLNLPPSIRFKTENIFLAGIVPGPKEPSYHEINYFLKPLVDDLVLLWRTGIYINKTSQHRWGRSVKGALGPLVCDLPAARLVSGFAPHNADDFMCSICTNKSRNNLNTSSWVARDIEHHREVAAQWLECQTSEERDTIFLQNGIRWSELLNLPYWDPIRFTVIDSMHCFYLRILQRHCRELWGMDVELEDGDGLWEVVDPSDEDKELGHRTLRYGSASALGSLSTHVLRYLALQHNLEHRENKKVLFARLKDLRVTKGWFSSKQELVYSETLDQDGVSMIGEVTTEGQSSNARQTLTLEEQKKSLDEARRAYRVGRTKGDLKFFYVDTLRELAKEEAIANFKDMLKDDLVTHLHSKRDKARKDEINRHVQNALEVPPEQEYKRMLEEASRTTIDKAHEDKLKGLILYIQPLIEAKRRSERNFTGRDEEDENDKSGAEEDEVTSQGNGDNRDDGVESELDSDSEEIEEIMKDKVKMKEYIHRQRRLLNITNDKDKVIKKTGKRKKPKTAVLGKERLAEIREDMVKLKLPSWMSIAPSNPGGTSHGKFSADQWRAFCTINLPITLVRLWGSESKDSRQHRMLVNFMHLVTATRLANMRTLTEERITKYEDHMHTYLKGIRQLFPEKKITAYQHMSLHFGSMLRRFGPVHSWRCFPFERYNYLIQNTPTNGRLGDLEKTFFDRFCMVQKLRRLLDEQTLPELLKPAGRLFNSIFDSDIRGTRIGDTLAFDAYFRGVEESTDWTGRNLTHLDPRTQAKLENWIDEGAYFIRGLLEKDKVQRLDVTFSTEKVAFADAQVVFKDLKLLSGWAAGSINRIFSARWRTVEGEVISRTFATIKPYIPLSTSDAKHDIHRQFGFAGGRLFYEDTDLEEVLLPVTMITAHFGYSAMQIAGIKRKTIHVLPQNKEFEFYA